MPKLAPKNNCTGCMACGDACNNNAISFELDNEGFFRYKVNPTLCINCKNCERVCHIQNAAHVCSDTIAKYYAAYSNLNNATASSSGGVFSAIATQFILDGGVVVGAMIDRKIVKHIIIDTIDELKSIQGSKYLQSNTSGIYKTVKKLLIKGKNVLFSGTSCQVAGLLSFLKHQYANLYTIDLVCHGVPSYELIHLYEKELGDVIMSIHSFRDKNNGWNSDYALSVITPQGFIRSKDNIFTDIYKGFLALRESCYNCPHRTIKRQSDITLGDFWRYNGNMKDVMKGLNMVMVNSNKGQLLIEKSPINKEEVTIIDILKSTTVPLKWTNRSLN